MIINKDYGSKVKLELTVDTSSNKVIKSEVLYNDNDRFWKTHLSLGYLFGDKIVHCSTCFGGSDWELLECISTAQSEAFYTHGEDFTTLTIDDLY